MQLLTTKQVILRIAIVFAVVEFIIMILLVIIPHDIHPHSEVLLDAVLLALVSTPILYFWVLKPFIVANDENVAQITHMALHDPLTQLANRRLFIEHLEKSLATYSRHKMFGALLFIDLDRFKPINDRYGHDAGDALLIETANRLQSISRSEDTVCRLGGDEFIVLINQLDSSLQEAQNRAEGVAGKMQALLSQPVIYNGHILQVQASIGIRMLDDKQTDTEGAIRKADIAMYRAKRSGPGHIFVHRESNASCQSRL